MNKGDKQYAIISWTPYDIKALCPWWSLKSVKIF